APAAPSTPGPIPRGSARRVIGAPTAGPPGRSGAPLYWPPEARTTAAPPLLPRTSGEGAPGAVPAPPHPGSEARMLHTTPQERLALGVVSLLLLAGAGARWLLAERPPAAWVESATGAADTPIRGASAPPSAETERALARERGRSTPLAPGERIDPTRASADELDRLPRVGPALAARIVAHREEHGPFRSLAELDAVPGVGPALLGSLAPHL